jgi:hypothetical protein
VLINLASQYFAMHDLPFHGVFYKLSFNYYINISEEQFENTKGVKRIRKLKKNRQHNDRKKKGQTMIYKTYKTKDRVTPTPLKTGSELRCSVMVGISCSNSDTRRVNLVTNTVISHE